MEYHSATSTGTGGGKTKTQRLTDHENDAYIQDKMVVLFTKTSKS